MAELVKIGKKGEVAEGEIKTFFVRGRAIALANINGEFFAIDDTCTHAQCSLGEGFMQGNVVTCPCHGSQFDVTSGQVLSLPAPTDVRSYKVLLEGNAILVEI